MGKTLDAFDALEQSFTDEWSVQKIEDKLNKATDIQSLYKMASAMKEDGAPIMEVNRLVSVIKRRLIQNSVSTSVLKRFVPKPIPTPTGRITSINLESEHLESGIIKIYRNKVSI